MTEEFQVLINDTAMKAKLKGLSGLLSDHQPVLQIFGAVMLGSIEQTFADQGSPASSWTPLSQATIRRRRNKDKSSIKILIDRGILKNSIHAEYGTDRVIVGTNLVYAAIQQFGGYAGRRSPSRKAKAAHKRKQRGGFVGPIGFRRPFIPARPFVVFRPEDPQRLESALDAYIAAEVAKQGGN